MSAPINYQTIVQDGKPAFVVIPYHDFIQMHPEVEEEPGIPHEVVKRIVRDDVSRIRAWREHLNFTQKEIADKIGVTQAALSQIESTGARPRKITLEKLAKAMGITVEQLR